MKNTTSAMRTILQRALAVAASSLYFGLSTFVATHADDSEIYITKLPEAQTPNVLFAVDTSGSMRENVPGTSQSRMEAVKEALADLINNTGNLKAGLSRFHPFVGSPIIFPVRDINKTFGDEEVFPDAHSIVSAINASTDDAEQNLATGSFSTDDPVLEMTEVQEPVSGYGLVTPQQGCFMPKDEDDDDEDGTSGNYDIDSPDLDIGEVNAGIRFFDVTIPQNAVILHAEVEFTARTGSSGSAGAIIHGHDVGDSPWFVNDPVTHADAVTPRINDAATDASVPWRNIRGVSTGDKITTPNIRTIVQEIVQHGGWDSGNPLTILFEEDGGLRELTSRDGDSPGDCGSASVDVPKLRVTYVLENEAAQFSRQPEGNGDDIWQAVGANDEEVNPDSLPLVTRNEAQPPWCDIFWWWSSCNIPAEAITGIRFPNVDIPDGAAVLWADIEFTAASENTEPLRSMRIRGVEEADPSPFNETNREPSDLAKTAADITWNEDTVAWDEEIFAPAGADIFHTPNLADLVSEIILDTGFASGNHMAFLIDDGATSGWNQQLACASSLAQTDDNCLEGLGKPELRVFYELPTSLDTSTQEVGLRFNNVRVPQGAEITSAYIDFVPETTSSQGGALTIDIENNVNPETYSTTNPINGRGWTGSQSWTVNAWQEGERTPSVDISGLVETVTNRNDWCGGQSLAFKVSGTAKLAAKAFESGSGNAPMLRVNYNTSELQSGEGCTTSSFVAPATDAIDNVFENSSGRVRNDLGELRLDNQPRRVGLRFKDVGIPQGAVINAARLTLTANQDRLDPTTITIKAQNHPNPPPFVLGSTSDVSGRSLAGDTVSWNPGPWTEGESYTANLADLIDGDAILQDIFDGDVTADGQVWESGNALVLVLESASNRRDIEQCCGEGETPPKLVIDYRVNLGDVIDPPAKELLLSTIADMQPDGNTPLTDALYEGAAYFAGAPVHFGRTRGAGASYDGNGQNDNDIVSTNINSNWDDNDILNYNGLTTGYANTRLSHPASYEGSPPIDRPSGCSEDNPNDYDCRFERIRNGQSTSYISPFNDAESCERGFLVLLSDGIARDNSSRQLIRDLTDVGSCSMDIPRLDEETGQPMLATGASSFVSRDPTPYEQCGVELSDWLYKQDFIDDGTVDTDVRNNVRTFTIGFNLDLDRSADRNAVEYLQALAYVGSGGDLDDVEANPDLQYGDGFYPANTASELRAVFETILQEIIQETTSFVAPGISVNAFNRLFNLDDIYFSLFRPGTKRSWKGNLKKFKLCTEIDDPDDGEAPSCEFGEVIDANAQPAVFDDISDLDTFGTLRNEALGIWSENTDRAPEIDEGGAGERIPDFEDRNVYVGLTDPSDTTATSYVLRKINRSAHTGDSVPPDDESFNEIKQALFDTGNCTSGTLAEQNDCLDDLVKWLTGEKFANDDPRNGEESDDNRWAFGDPMHSRPLVITYGKHESAADGTVTPLSKVFLGTNDGGFRMVNDSGGISAANDGVEEWIYYPYSMLDRQSALKDNPDGDHIYGVDDSPAARVNDVDSDGVIEPADGDFVHLYFGLRRGGRQIFAVDVTPSSQITGANLMNQITPRLLWRIDAENTPEFQYLGQTWSSPRPVRIALDDGPRTVLIFGGGYSSGEQDGSDASGADKYATPVSGDNTGNGIYIVDATTGELLWWATSHTTDTGADVDQKVVPEMNTSIAASVTGVSTDGDPFVDQIYAVDLRGQVFRVDLATTTSPGAGESVLSASTVGVLAALGDSDEQDRRKFFYAPEVAPVIDQQAEGGTYNLIGIVSGNRSRPQGKTVLDRAYGLRDYHVSGQLTDSNFPACNPLVCTGQKTGASGASPINHDSGDLVNVTEQSSFVIRNEDGSLSATEDALNNLKNSYGWYFNLEGANIFDADATGLTGEKGFSAATVLDGKMFFTTFLPPETDAEGNIVEDACSIPETLGTSRLYAIDFFTGAPAFSDFSGDPDAFEKTDRFRNLGSGPSADLVPAYLPGGTILPVPTGAGAVVQDPRISETAEKTFWTENQ